MKRFINNTTKNLCTLSHCATPRRQSFGSMFASAATTLAVALGMAMPADARPVNVPGNTTLAAKVDLGLLAPNATVQVTALGYVDLYSSNHYLTFADGSLAVPFTGPIITWAMQNSAYPTLAGGDGINHYPGGGTNWNGSTWSELGAQSTDTLNPNTIRFGTLVGTFNPTPAAGDWFVLGRHAIVTAPPGGGHLYAAVVDCTACAVDNAGSYSVTIGSRLYSLSDDFNAVNNPGGPWSYGFRLATDPASTFTAFADRYFGYQAVIGGWNGTSQTGNDLPGVSKNYSAGSVMDGFSAWAANELLGHPGTIRDCAFRFTAPTAGIYRLSGSLRGLSLAGTTSTVFIRHGAAILFQANVTGYQTVVTVPQQDVQLAAGEIIDVTVTKGRNNNYNSDSTGVNLIIEHRYCPADITGNGAINVSDLLAVISAWGACVGCPADTNNDGLVNVSDLLAVISAWGTCPP